MKRIIIVACLLVVVTLKTFAGNGFYVEFKMTLTNEKGGATGTMKTYQTDEGSGRSEVNMAVLQMPGGINMAMIHKASEPGKIYMVNDAAKTYSVMDVSKYKTDAAGAKEEHKYEVTVVGKETVNGYAATHVKIKLDGKEMEDMWTSKDINSYQKYARMSASKYALDETLWGALLAKGADGFPVKILKEEREGKMQLDLVKAEKLDIASSLVEIPADYTKGNMVDNVLKQMNMPTMEQLSKMTPEERERVLQQIQDRAKQYQTK